MRGTLEQISSAVIVGGGSLFSDTYLSYSFPWRFFNFQQNVAPSLVAEIFQFFAKYPLVRCCEDFPLCGVVTLCGMVREVLLVVFLLGIRGLSVHALALRFLPVPLCIYA